MVLIKLNKPDYEYDVQSLVKSFYPNREVGFKQKESVYVTIDIKYDELAININISNEEISFGDKISVDYLNRKDTKNRLKKLLYMLLHKLTNITLPWGTLSGIRPTKIPVALMEEGYDDSFIKSYLKETYLVSDEKISLSMEVAKNELELLKEIDYKEGYSLYIGIPFCPSTCSYCSFTSYSIVKYENVVSEYLQALYKEIEFTSELVKGKKLNSVYIGGGTPTSLTHQQLDELLEKVVNSFDLTYCLEFTVEAGRPDSIDRDKLNVIKKHGIDRISINPQTMNDETLKIIGRKHSVQDVYTSFALARECGFTNINMDFIIGLPDETYEDVLYSMEQTLALKPDCITIHSLAIKRAARMNTEKEQYEQYSLNNNEDIMKLTADYAKKMDLAPYYLYRQKNMAGNMENVGYAAKGKASIYNILIMEEKQSIIALGAGAITKLVFDEGRIERINNVKSVEHYINRIDEMIERKAQNIM